MYKYFEIIILFFLGFLSSCFIERNTANKEANCYYSKDLEMILRIDYKGNYLLVNNESLMGTTYLLTEKGHIKRDGTLVTFTLTKIANFEASNIKFDMSEDAPYPLKTYGEFRKEGNELLYMGGLLKKCSCSKRTFKPFDQLKDF